MSAHANCVCVTDCVCLRYNPAEQKIYRPEICTHTRPGHIVFFFKLMTLTAASFEQLPGHVDFCISCRLHCFSFCVIMSSDKEFIYFTQKE